VQLRAEFLPALVETCVGLRVSKGRWHESQVMGWVEQGLTSHQTHYLGYIGDDFYRSYDQSNSVKALKETSWSCR